MNIKIADREFSFEEFRAIAQSKKAVSDPMYRKLIVRKISIFLTIICLRLKISANAITSLSMFFGVGAFIAFIANGYAGLLMALLFMQLWYVFDTVDGEIARYYRHINNTEDKLALSGLFFDNINHHLIHALIIFGFSMAVFELYLDIKVLIAGFLLMLDVMFVRLISDLKATAFMSRITKKKNLLVLTNAYTIPSGNTGIKARIFSVIFSLFLFPKILNILSVLIILLMASKFNFTGAIAFIIICYAALGTMVMFVKVYRIISAKRPEEEYNKRFKEIE